MLDPHPRAQLCFIIQQYGQNIITEPKRCRGMLSDLAPHHRLENNLLVAALEQKVAQELLQPSALIPLNMQLERLAKRLHDTVGMKEEFAYWAVESWALALGVNQSTLKTSPTPQPVKEGKADRVEVVRKKHPNAYAKWSALDDDSLRKKYAEGSTIGELAKLLHRTEGAIQSRLTKLHIQPPLPTKTITIQQRIGKFIVQVGYNAKGAVRLVRGGHKVATTSPPETVKTQTSPPVVPESSSKFFAWWIVGFIFIATVYIYSGSQSENNNALEQPTAASIPTLSPPQAVTKNTYCIGNCINGQGTLTYTNGDKYIGNFENGKADGQGTFTYQDGSKYVGEFKNGQLVKNNPQATTQADNRKLAPDAVTPPSKPDKTQARCIKGNCVNGHGTQTYPDGSKYIGEFKNGLSDGQGTLILPNGDKYVGKFKQNKFQQ
ncbi:hypothetical protein BCS42_13365 [Crenothrix sp. D3]|nr:hypothetical protein BCS42_13365 [Crenothrix sp. D3]